MVTIKPMSTSSYPVVRAENVSNGVQTSPMPEKLYAASALTACLRGVATDTGAHNS